jgi:CheY-like chemotaxis protein
MGALSALAIDDYAPARYVHTRVLKSAGFDIYEAADGHTGLALAQVHLPSVVLLDINLPDIHGFEVCKRLKSSPPTRGIPVIHLTATSRGDTYRRESVASGADVFLEEPVEPQLLVRLARELTSKPRTLRVQLGKVLILSPYEDEYEMYRTALEAAGFHVTCGSPLDGVQLTRQVAPDVVVTRIRPGDAGLSVARALKRDAATSRLPIVMITTYTDREHRDAAAEIGVAAYHVLPFGPDALVNQVSRLVLRSDSA